MLFISIAGAIVCIFFYFISLFHPLSGLFYVFVTIVGFAAMDILVREMKRVDPISKKKKKSKGKKSLRKKILGF